MRGGILCYTVEVNRQALKRNYGVDALRILAMFLIIIWHMLGHGGMLAHAEAFSDQYQVVWSLEIIASCAVNCYALISGYVGVGARYKYSNLAMIWLRTLFYSAGISLLFVVFMPGTLSFKTIIKSFFPVAFGEYWYVTAYAGLFLLMPLLNLAIKKMTKKQLGIVLGTALFAFSAVPTVLRKDVFCLNNGCSTLWLIILYFLGGFLREYDILSKLRTKKIVMGYIVVVISSIVLRNICEAFGFYGTFLFTNTSPIVLTSSVCLLLMFARWRVGSVGIRIIELLAPLSFSVYLIHDNNLVREFLMKDAFVKYLNLPPFVLLLVIISTAVCIYLVCSVIDVVRNGIFDKLHIKQYFTKIETKRIGTLWNED